MEPRVVAVLRAQVFDVVLNGDHTIVSDLDIFERVGKGVSHDEYVPFRVEAGRLHCNEEESDIRGGKIRVEFIKVQPSCCAVLV